MAREKALDRGKLSGNAMPRPVWRGGRELEGRGRGGQLVVKGVKVAILAAEILRLKSLQPRTHLLR
jgi:hypothetical protein